MEAKQMYEETVKKLKEHVEWAESNIYYVPVMMPDDLAAAADTIESFESELNRRADENRPLPSPPEGAKE
jgi:predicted metal-dependent hydrolase